MRESGMNPRLLLVEDDAVSQAYLADAARALPATVDCAGTLADALALAAQHQYDAWLIDAHLPDGRGADLLARLRQSQPAPNPPALAHTATQQPEDLDALHTAGFDAVVSKPLSIDAWQAAVRQCLADADADAASSWDDDSALRALNGNAEAVSSLRQLFLAELPRQRRLIRNALDTGDDDAARAELHRLKASCGFVGAMRMRQAVDALHAAPADAHARDRFDAAITELLAGPPSND